MSKRGPRFSKKEKLAIVKEGEKTGVEAVCAKYDISDQSYRLWRYKALGIQPKKQLSCTEKLRILEEGYNNGVNRVCAVHRIDPMTYCRWKKALGYSKSRRRGRPRRFSREEVLAIVKEAEKTSTKAVCEKYKISPSRYSVWHYEVTGIPLLKRFSLEEKRRILEEGYQNGIYRVCNARQIHPTTYYYWKKVLGYSKRRLSTEKEGIQIVNDAIAHGITKASEKYHLSGSAIHRWARRLGLQIPRRSRFNIREKRAILQEATRNGTGVTCRAYKIDPNTLRYWRRKLGL
jgi:transposase-like protein